MSSDYGHEQRAAALTLEEGELRRRVDVLLEQCGRESAHPPYLRGLPTVDAPFLYVSEILMLLGVGPTVRQETAESLEEVIDGTVDGIRPHLPTTPADDDRRQRFADEFSGHCADGTCGVCGACELRRDEPPLRVSSAFRLAGRCSDGTCGRCGVCVPQGTGGCPFCGESAVPDLRSHVRSAHPVIFREWINEEHRHGY